MPRPSRRPTSSLRRSPSRPLRRAAPFALAAAALALALPVSAKNVLFVGNSFFYAPFIDYPGVGVVDLNHSGYSGVPGLFKTFSQEAGLPVDVSVELVGGQSLKYHDTNKLAQIGSASWDLVVMQDYSTLDPAAPGNPANLYAYSKRLEQFVHGTRADAPNPNANPAAEVYLMQTWARADQVYATPASPWYGTSVETMTGALHDAYDTAAAMDPAIKGVIHAGDAWLRAIVSGAADRNPYDGIDPGKASLWGPDNYHQSAFGSYLEALMIFGQTTGVDPRTLGAGETAAQAIGLSATLAAQAQQLAWQQLQVSPVPEPGTWALMLGGLGAVALVGWANRRRDGLTA